jgi:dihydroorotate dehydrogenase
MDLLCVKTELAGNRALVVNLSAPHMYPSNVMMESVLESPVNAQLAKIVRMERNVVGTKLAPLNLRPASILR